jgi:hypothetical protein
MILISFLALYRVSGWKVSKIKKKLYLRKLTVILSYTFSVYVGKENSESFFFQAQLNTCASRWPSVSSVTMSTPQEQVQCVLRLAELWFLTTVQCHFRTQYGHQPPTRKTIRFWDSKLRTTGSLLHAKSPGKNGPLKKMSIALQRHSSKVRANKFMLLACSYKFHIQQCMMCYMRGSTSEHTRFKWFMH